MLLCFEDEDELRSLSQPNIERNEETRVYYVALSRSRDRLFIHIPGGSKAPTSGVFDGVEVVHLS